MKNQSFLWLKMNQHILNILSIYYKSETFTVLEINPCDGSPCINSGVCTKTGPGLYECGCQFGYDGKNCDNGKVIWNGHLARKFLLLLNLWTRNTGIFGRPCKQTQAKLSVGIKRLLFVYNYYPNT